MGAQEGERPGLLRRVRRWLVMAAVALAVTSVLGFVAYQLRAPLLTRLGGLLYHEDVLEPADAIVVLGGGQLDRVIEAADLFSEGYAPVVLLTREPESPAIAELQARGLDVPSSLEARLDYLEALGVPLEAITVLERVVESTQTEAELVTEWSESRQVDRVIVVTSGFHTSRARRVFAQALQDRATDVLVRPSRTSGFDPATWWRTRSGFRAGLFELQKYAYYRVMYLIRQTP